MRRSTPANDEQFGPPIGSPEGSSNEFSRRSATLGAGDGPDDGQFVQPGFPGQDGLRATGGGLDFVSKAHDDKVTQWVTKSTCQRLIIFSGNCQSIQVNENWPQQEVFCTRVHEFAVREGLVSPRGALKLEPLALWFKISAGTLKQDLQNKSRKRPGVEKLIAIAEIIGCSRNEFWKTEAPPGVPEDEWEKAPDASKVHIREIFEDLLKFSPEEQAEYKKLFLQGMAIGLSRMESEKAGRSAPESNS